MINKFWKNKTGKKIAIGNFNFEFDLEFDFEKQSTSFEVNGIKDWNSLINEDFKGIWKYEPVLPITKGIVSEFCKDKDELVRPVEIPEIAELLKVKKFFIFPCTYGRSGNFKDIEASFVIAKVLEWNHKYPISFHSTGNTARAYREYAIEAALESTAFFPLQCVNKFIGATPNRQNKLIAYNGPFKDISAFAKKWASDNDHLHLAPLRWKVEGKVPLGYHIMKENPRTTHIIQTIAGGYGTIGIYEALKRLKNWGLINHLPQFKLFQIFGADTISQLMPLNSFINDTDLKLESNSFEPTLQSTNPLSTFNHVRHLLINSNSEISSVHFSDVIKYSEELISICEKYEVPISFVDEKSPFISYAGLRLNSKANYFKGDEIISFILTGSKKRTGEIPTIDLIINP